jgi:arylsulfatase A-like enzyme
VIQSGQWKLMEYLEDGRLELYNLAEDIGESNNLAKAKPEKAKELHDRLVAWRAEVNAPMPQKNDAKAESPSDQRKKKARAKKGKKSAAS